MASIVEIEHLTREFKVLNRKSGLKGKITDLFSRDYSIVKAVDDLSLQINEGEVVGFLGPNGAGKSTTIKMMIGVLQASSGKILVNGMEPYQSHEEYVKNIGVVFGQRTQLWWALPVRESFHILKTIYQVSDEEYNDTMELYENIIGISELLSKPARQLSLGQRTLCDILAAFIHNPKVVFLDEPTIGLDVAMKHKIHQLIKELNIRKNTTVILTTHDMGDVNALCKRVIVINKGKSMFDDSIEKLSGYFGEYKVISLRNIDDKDVFLNRLENLLKEEKNADGNVNILLEEQRMDLIVNEQKISVLQLLNLIQPIIRGLNFNVSEISTEEIIRKMYEGGVKN